MGGMIVIGIVNIAIGLKSYKPMPGNPQKVELHLHQHDAGVDAQGTIGNKDLPAEVMRAFAQKYPRLIPAGATVVGTHYVISFPPGGELHHATFDATGAFVGDD